MAVHGGFMAKLESEEEPARQERVWFCPSAQPSLAGSLIFGVVKDTGEAQRVTFLERPVKVSEGTVLAFAGGQQRATDIFRFAAPCQQKQCRNWSGHSCRVGERLVQILPASSALPECKLRSVCLWFHQEGGSACLRCTQMVTNDPAMEIMLNTLESPEDESKGQKAFMVGAAVQHQEG
jgi:hypothetical protein